MKNAMADKQKCRGGRGGFAGALEQTSPHHPKDEERTTKEPMNIMCTHGRS